MTDDGPAEVVLREEVARTGVQRVATRIARLQRVVVRERRTIEVEVAHEEYRVVVDDLDPGTVPMIEEGPRSASTVLHEERIEVVRRVVPVERVTMTAQPMTEQAAVDVELRHEEAEFDRG